MDSRQLRPAPMSSNSGLVQSAVGVDLSSLSGYDTHLADSLHLIPHFPNAPSLPNASVTLAQHNATTSQEHGKRKRQLEFVKCDDCRKVKQKVRRAIFPPMCLYPDDSVSSCRKTP